MTTFTPTHRTNRRIGSIEAETPIRVVKYAGNCYFSQILTQLGLDTGEYLWDYLGQNVKFRALHDTWSTILDNDYVITDGENIEATSTDIGWNPISARNVGGTEEVIITFHETYYAIHGKETGTVLRVTPQEILSLADRIKDFVPEPSPIEDARFISARILDSEDYRTLAKIDGIWYSHNGVEYTEQQVLDNYDDIKVIR